MSDSILPMYDVQFLLRARTQGIDSSGLVRSAYSALRICTRDISSDRLIEVGVMPCSTLCACLHGAPAVGFVQSARRMESVMRSA